MISIKDAQKSVKEFVREKNWESGSLEIFNHLVEEVGEVARELRNNNKDNLKNELGDVLFLLFKLSNQQEIDLADAFTNKFKLIKEKFGILDSDRIFELTDKEWTSIEAELVLNKLNKTD